jgi:hypothetical protein
MRAKRLLIAVPFLILGPTAQASDWIFIVGDGKSDTNVAVEMTSISVKGGLVSAWSRVSTKTPQKFPKTIPGVDTTKPYTTVKILMVFDCIEKISAASSSAYYAGPNGDDTLLGSFAKAPGRSDFVPVIPDTLGETIMQYVCKHQNDNNGWEVVPKLPPKAR